MALTKEECKWFDEVMAGAFPNYISLEKMVDHQLGENLEGIVGNGPVSDAVFRLRKWAVSQGKLPDLVKGAFKENSGYPELRMFYEHFFSTYTDVYHVSHLVQPQYYDLDLLFNNMLDNLDTHPCGPLGLAVDCDDADFYEYFCLRLQKEVNDSCIPSKAALAIKKLTNDENMPQQQLSDWFQSAEARYTIVHVQTRLEAKHYQDFWNKVRENENLRNPSRCLIVVLPLSEKEWFKDDPLLIFFGRPLCSKRDAFRWVKKVLSAQNFKDSELEKLWEDLICRECNCESPDKLKVVDMYRHIQGVRKLLLEANNSQDEFKKALKEKMERLCIAV